MKKAMCALMAALFISLSGAAFAEDKKEAPKKAKKDGKKFWDTLPQEVKDKVMAVNKKVKAGELTEEEGKTQKKAIFAEFKKSKAKK